MLLARKAKKSWHGTYMPGKAMLLLPWLPWLGCRGGHKSAALAGLDWLFQAVLFWQARPKARQAWPGRALPGLPGFWPDS